MSRRAGLLNKAPSTFTVTLRPHTDGYNGTTSIYIGYSLDGGTTYTDLKATKTTDTIINDVTTIMFRAKATTDTAAYVSNEDNTVTLVVAFNTTTKYSPVQTLKSNRIYTIYAN